LQKVESELKVKEGLLKENFNQKRFYIFILLEFKKFAEIPEKAAKEKHQKLWEGLLIEHIHH
jgi:hypothetical protein